MFICINGFREARSEKREENDSLEIFTKGENAYVLLLIPFSINVTHRIKKKIIESLIFFILLRKPNLYFYMMKHEVFISYV